MAIQPGAVLLARIRIAKQHAPLVVQQGERVLDEDLGRNRLVGQGGQAVAHIERTDHAVASRQWQHQAQPGVVVAAGSNDAVDRQMGAHHLLQQGMLRGLWQGGVQRQRIRMVGRSGGEVVVHTALDIDQGHAADLRGDRQQLADLLVGNRGAVRLCHHVLGKAADLFQPIGQTAVDLLARVFARMLDRLALALALFHAQIGNGRDHGHHEQDHGDQRNQAGQAILAVLWHLAPPAAQRLQGQPGKDEIGHAGMARTGGNRR